jgi:outer membrane protein OmpA-like peptidoglycan-associated protein
LGGDTTSSAARSLTYSNPATPIEITSVNFATAKSTLTKSAKSKLNAFASQVSALGLNTLVIQGHTDSVGGIDNQALSNARAQAAAKYLRSKLANVKITVKGFGPNDPIADNNSDEGRAQNRRAGVYIGG